MPGPFHPAYLDPENRSGEWLGAVTEQRHLLQAQYTDGLVGEMLGELEAGGLYDDSLVIVAADHGISFEPDTSLRALRAGDLDGLDGLAYAPLLIKPPGQRAGTIDDASMMSIDLLPTIAALVGLEAPFEMQGFAAGSQELTARGDERFFFDLEGPAGSEKTLREVVHFDGAQYFPSASNRWIGPIAHGDEPAHGLYERLGIADHIGRPLDQLDPRPGGRAEVGQLAALRQGSEKPPHGLVLGHVTSPTTPGTALLAINGTVVSASPLFDHGNTPNSFAMLLPPGVVERDNEIRIALLTPDGAVELELSG